MRSLAVFLALVGYLLASPFPVTAQGRMSTPTPYGDWSRAMKLKPGAEIIVTIRGFQPVRRSVVRAEASQLTLLNVIDSGLPRKVGRVLLNIASRHPEAFTSELTGTFMERDVSIGPDGVFLGDLRIAELRDVAETIARNDIAEITTRRKGGGILGHLGPLGGYFVGGLTGGYLGGFLCRCESGFLPGMLAGGISGGIAGYRSAAREKEELLYRAP